MSLRTDTFLKDTIKVNEEKCFLKNLKIKQKNIFTINVF